MKKFRTDSAVHANRSRDFMYVTAYSFAQVRNLINERDFCREKGVRGAFDRSDDDWGLNQVQGAIELSHYFRSFCIIASDYDTIRPHEVGDRGPFTQEFRI